MRTSEADVCALANIVNSFFSAETGENDAGYQALHLRAYISLPAPRDRASGSGEFSKA